jgi:epoxyqueuosine reductase
MHILDMVVPLARKSDRKTSNCAEKGLDGVESLVKVITGRIIHHLATECGFGLAGVAPAGPVSDFPRYRDWVNRGLAGEMRYLTDHRADLRSDPASLLPGVRSIISVGLLYNGPEPYSTAFSDSERAWISRYAWGEDYHKILRQKLKELDMRLSAAFPGHRWKACVDTAPILERSIARQAGLGWIGKNTCLINQNSGSWFFLGELLTTLQIEPNSPPPPDRCGSCTRCIDACPTAALTPYELDATLCISYFTIELRGAIPEQKRSQIGPHIFGCDICQDVCPWNRQAPETQEPEFHPRQSSQFAPALERMAELTELQFKAMFRDTPVSRAKYSGFLRNVAVAMGNSGLRKFHEPLTRLANSGDPLVAEHAVWALRKMEQCPVS